MSKKKRSTKLQISQIQIRMKFFLCSTLLSWAFDTFNQALSAVLWWFREKSMEFWFSLKSSRYATLCTVDTSLIIRCDSNELQLDKLSQFHFSHLFINSFASIDHANREWEWHDWHRHGKNSLVICVRSRIFSLVMKLTSSDMEKTLSEKSAKMISRHRRHSSLSSCRAFCCMKTISRSLSRANSVIIANKSRYHVAHWLSYAKKGKNAWNVEWLAKIS